MPKISDRIYRIALLGVTVVFISICIAGCSNPGRRMATVFKWNTKINLMIDNDANQTSGIAVDVVSPLTDKTEAALMKMSARKWFTNKQQFARDYLLGNDYLVVHNEFVPGTTPDPITIPFKVKTKALIIYADYLSKGNHRYRSTLPGEDLDMHLMRYKFSVKPKDSDYGNEEQNGSGGSGNGGSGGGGSSGSAASKLRQTAENVAKNAAQQVEQQESQNLASEVTGTDPAATTDTTGTTSTTDTSSSSSVDNIGEISFGF